MLDYRGKYSYACMCIQWMWWCLAELHHNTSLNFNTRNLKRVSLKAPRKKIFQRWWLFGVYVFLFGPVMILLLEALTAGYVGRLSHIQEKSTYQISMPMVAIVLQIAEVVSEVFRVGLGCFQEIRLMNSYHPWGCGIHTVNMKLIIQRIPSGGIEKDKCIVRLRFCFNCSGSNVFVFEQYLIWFWTGCVYTYYICILYMYIITCIYYIYTVFLVGSSKGAKRPDFFNHDDIYIYNYRKCCPISYDPYKNYAKVHS